MWEKRGNLGLRELRKLNEQHLVCLMRYDVQNMVEKCPLCLNPGDQEKSDGTEAEEV